MPMFHFTLTIEGADLSTDDMRRACSRLTMTTRPPPGFALLRSSISTGRPNASPTPWGQRSGQSSPSFLARGSSTCGAMSRVSGRMQAAS